MISRPDNEIIKKIPKRATFSILLSDKWMDSVDEDVNKEEALSKCSLVLENPKEYDPIKDVSNIEQMFKDAGDDNLGSFTVYTYPERLLYEQHALEMRFITINPSTIDPSKFFVKIIDDDFRTKEEEMIVNDRVRAAVKLTGFIMNISTIDLPSIENADKEPGYIYKISDSTTVGEKYTINKTEYDLFGFDKVVVHEFIRMPEVEGSILDKLIEGDNNGD